MLWSAKYMCGERIPFPNAKKKYFQVPQTKIKEETRKNEEKSKKETKKNLQENKSENNKRYRNIEKS
jgi:hypothetical protein